MRFNVIGAVFKRNLSSFFTSVLGYLFIVAFVIAAGWLAFSPRFFVANQPSLDQLTQYFPELLLFIIPAITMTVWSDEKKLGTDELLFTLPASDFEILIGKYLSVLAVYTVTLLFAVVQVAVLEFLGNPDYGVLLTTYIGYWAMGAALIAAGMLASSLTSNTTVAFVLGVMLCLCLVYFGQVLSAVLEFAGATSIAKNVEALGFHEQMRDFGLGLIPLSGVLFFLVLTVFMLYLNYIVISKRHWSSSQKTDMGTQFALRAVCLAVSLVSVCYLASSAAFSIDRTAEKLYTLTPATEQVLKKLGPAVTIEAYVSPDIPREYVNTQKQLDGLLKQYDRVGGSKVRYSREVVTRFSKEAEAAQDLGIEPRVIMSDRAGRMSEEQIFLGAVVRCEAENGSNRENVIPFFGKGLPIEYELTRSIQTVAQEERLKVGILKTDANILSEGNEWKIVTELRKQYEIVDVSPTSEIETGRFNVLLAVMPSSLTQSEMTNLVNYVKAGGPTLIFDDPCPMIFRNQFGIAMAPRLPKPSPGGGGMMGMQRQPAPPKAEAGKLTAIQRLLGISWDNGKSVFDESNPHPEFALVPKQIVFVTKSNGNPVAFNQDSEITSGLQEVVALFPGVIQEVRKRTDTEFKKLLVTGPNSGSLEWEEYMEDSFNPFQMSAIARPKGVETYGPFRDEYAHVLAAHVTSESGLNCVFAADIDMITDLFFDEWNQQNMPVKFDNVTFVLNAVDILAGEESFTDLRKRREAHRSLQTIEKEKDQFLTQRAEDEEEAEEQMEEELAERKKTLMARIEEIEKDDSLDTRAKSIQVEQARANQQRRLDVESQNLELEKQKKIEQSRAKSQRSIREIETRYRLLAIFIPALLPIAIGLLVLGIRLTRERQTIAPSRLRSSK
ncbi:MAG: Gldg family protein [Planctomycetaceae bacterium]